MMEDSQIVSREVYFSVVYFDLAAVVLWIALILINKHYRPAIFMAVGYAIYLLVDAVFWMAILKIRVIHSDISPWLIQLWLQLGPGIIHPSWVCLMLEGTFGREEDRKRINRTFWTFAFFLVQFCPVFFQQSFHTDDKIVVSRTMDSQRGFFILFGCLGYMYLCYQKVPVKHILTLLLIGFTAEGFFEFSLFLSGVRQESLKTVLFDSLLEFNVGMPYIFILWIMMYKKDQRANLNLDNNSFSEPLLPYLKTKLV